MWASLDIELPGNLIGLDLTAHLGLERVKLDAPIKHRCKIQSKDVVLDLTEFVTLNIQSADGRYCSKEVVALVVPHEAALSAQIVLGAPFIKDNLVEIDGTLGRAWIADSDIELVHATREMKMDPCEKKLPRLTREKAKTPSKVAAVREQIEILTAKQALLDRGDQIKRDFPRLLEELPHGDDLPTDVFCRIKLKSAEQTIKTRSYGSPRKYREAWRTLIDGHLAAGRIRPSSSPHVSPAFLIPKANPLVLPRWVNDYRILNSNTVMDSYPLPRIDGILADCGRGKVFSKMDMTNPFSKREYTLTTCI